MAFDPVSPISHPVNVSVLPVSGRREHLRPDAEALGKLARAHDLLAVSSFEADLAVRKWQRDGVRVTGRVRAAVSQACVVTLDPVEARIETDIDAVFLPEGSRLLQRTVSGDSMELVIDPEGEDVPETFTPPNLDLGAIAEEFFVLALDPFPRSAAAPKTPIEHLAPVRRENPFAVLARLKDNKSGE